jgi:hypothetical protein
MKSCNHKDPLTFTPNENSKYFNQAYYDKKENPIRHCLLCDDDKELDTDIKVNAANPVYSCHNCTDETCNAAYCNMHYKMLQKEQEELEKLNDKENTTKINKRSRNTNPVDRFDFDNYIKK